MDMDESKLYNRKLLEEEGRHFNDERTWVRDFRVGQKPQAIFWCYLTEADFPFLTGTFTTSCTVATIVTKLVLKLVFKYDDAP